MDASNATVDAVEKMKKCCSLARDQITILMNWKYSNACAVSKAVKLKVIKINGRYRLQDRKVQLQMLIVVNLNENCVFMEPENVAVIISKAARRLLRWSTSIQETLHNQLP